MISPVYILVELIKRMRKTAGYGGHMLVILALGRLRQEVCELQASLGYVTRLCLKKKR
jgi:hypothetical protein